MTAGKLPPDSSSGPSAMLGVADPYIIHGATFACLHGRNHELLNSIRTQDLHAISKSLLWKVLVLFKDDCVRRERFVTGDVPA